MGRGIKITAAICMSAIALLITVMGMGFAGGIGPLLLGGAIQTLVVVAVGVVVVGILRISRRVRP